MWELAELGIDHLRIDVGGAFRAAEPAERSLSDRWMDWGTIYLYPKVIALMTAKGSEELEAAIENVAVPCRILDEALSGSRFIAGDTLSMGDISVAVHLGRLFRFAVGRLPYANLERYFTEISARPGYQIHCAQALA